MPRSPTTRTQRVQLKRRGELRQAFVDLPKSKFWMGSDDDDARAEDFEGPVREVEVGPFAIATTVVSNAQFRQFCNDTDYQTDAEREGWSFVFAHFVSKRIRKYAGQATIVDPAPWWLAVPGANWLHPEGPGSTLYRREHHPVVHVTWNDATAFCAWAQCRLPTETEWEFAARGGLERKRYPWGDELTPGGMHRCNIWQGKFPKFNSKEDGFAGTAPVDAYEPNGYGLYNVAGNVWEWCENWFGSSSSSAQFRTGKALRGGSYLCHASYCNRYRVAARYANALNTSTGNCGFRVVRL